MHLHIEKGRHPYFFIKRAFDIIASVALIFFLFIPMLVIWIAIRIDSSGRGIFKQVRIGRGGSDFVCYKFRTMHTGTPQCATKDLKNVDKYVTRVGRFLRRSSLDELPQLFNILKGDMSFVGPRPLIAEEKNVHERRMLSGVYSIRPGLTGLSQICGRDALSDDRKVELDAAYLSHLGLWQDIKIMASTFKKVILGDGIAGYGLDKTE